MKGLFSAHSYLLAGPYSAAAGLLGPLGLLLSQALSFSPLRSAPSPSQCAVSWLLKLFDAQRTVHCLLRVKKKHPSLYSDT